MSYKAPKVVDPNDLLSSSSKMMKEGNDGMYPSEEDLEVIRKNLMIKNMDEVTRLKLEVTRLRK